MDLIRSESRGLTIIPNFFGFDPVQGLLHVQLGAKERNPITASFSARRMECMNKRKVQSYQNLVSQILLELCSKKKA